MPDLADPAVDVVTSPLLHDVPHGFLGRAGGFSQGMYQGLNVGLGSDDDRETIMKNRDKAKNAILPGSKLVTLHQIHSAEVILVDQPIDISGRPHADAMVTQTSGLLLGILTADCVPVLFCDNEARVVAAAHAGWKGAIAGVTDNTLIAMEKLGARRENIACAIGPCIAQDSYEVDAGFQQQFLEVNPDNDRFFRVGKPGHFQFDIEAYVANRLMLAGVQEIDKLGLDTYASSDRYYSYRRSCHHGEPGYGRQISLIGLGE